MTNNHSNRTLYQQKQLFNYASLLHKLTMNQHIRIVCQGDSMTYGQDTFSNDRRPAKSDPTCEGQCTYSNHKQAGKTYPEALQEFSNQLFAPGKVKINNRGYSGDWAEISKTRWKDNPEADLHLLMLGTNDASTGDHVPKNVQQNLVKYTNDMCALIEQILDFQSAVVLLTPPKHSNETEMMRIVYRQVLKQIGAIYQIPVIDTTNFLKGIPFSEVQSDDVHYNSKGYTIMAAKIAGLLAGIRNIYEPYHVKAGQIIEPSFHQYGLSMQGEQDVTLKESASAPYGFSSESSKGLMFHLPAKSRLTFSFTTDTDGLSITPLFAISETQSPVKLNILLDFAVGNNSIHRINTAEKAEKNNFHLPTKGFYSITIDNQSPSQHVEVYGFKVTKTA